MTVEERLDLLWEYIGDCVLDIPAELRRLLDFIASHDICIFILVCFIISAAVLFIKRLISVSSRL